MASATIDSLLRDLQGAVSVAGLYPADHPRAVELRRRVVEAVDELTRDRSEIALFAADDRVIVNGQVWSGGPQLARGLFATLATCGQPRLVIRRGLQVAELLAFVIAVSHARQVGEGASLEGSEHLRLSTVSDDRGALHPDWSSASSHDHPLIATWRTLCDEQRFDVDAIQFLVMSLSAAIEENGHMLVPLAALRSHDEYTVTHITNVATLAMALGRVAGLPPAALRELGIAALLHDIGKLRVPSEILNFHGRLDEAQATIVRCHPVDGARILLGTPGVPDLAVAVAYEHHVQFDGVGYPTLPPHWKVNVASHMTMIADVYDALRTDRPYRAGLSAERIASIMTQEAGTAFEPSLLQLFFERVVPYARVSESVPTEAAETSAQVPAV